MFNESITVDGVAVHHRGFNDQLRQHLPALVTAYMQGKLALQIECANIQRCTYISIDALIGDNHAVIMGQGEIITFSEV